MPEQPERRRQTTIRGLSLETMALLKSRAHARGWSVAQYIEALMKLHGALMVHSELNDDSARFVRDLLIQSGLEQVRV